MASDIKLDSEIKPPGEHGEPTPPQLPDKPTPKEPAKRTEQQDIQTIRKVLGFDKQSPLKSAGQIAKERQETTDRFIEDRLQQALAAGEGFIDKNKKKMQEPQWKASHGVYDTANRFLVVQALKLGKVTSADAVVNVLSENSVFSHASEMQQPQVFLNIKLLAETLSPEQIQVGLDRLKILGLDDFRDSSVFKNPEFIQSLIRVAQASQEAFDTVCNQLNPNYHLFTSSITEPLPRGTSNRLSRGFQLIIEAVANGGFTDKQIAKLEKANRLALLNHMSPPTVNPSSGRDHIVACAGSRIEDVLDNTLDAKTIDDMELLTRDMVHHNLQYQGIEYKAVDGSFYEKLHAMQQEGFMPFLTELTEKGFDCLHVVQNFHRSNQEERAELKKQLTDTYALLSDPQKLEWMRLFHEIRGEKRVDLMHVQRYGTLYNQRQEMGDYFTFLSSFEQLPDEYKIGPRDTFFIENDNIGDQYINPRNPPKFNIVTSSIGEKLSLYNASHQRYIYGQEERSAFDTYAFMVNSFFAVDQNSYRQERRIAQEDLPLLAYLGTHIDQIKEYIRHSNEYTPHFSSKLIEDILDGQIPRVTPQLAAKYVDRFYVVFSPRLLESALAGKLPVSESMLQNALLIAHSRGELDPARVQEIIPHMRASTFMFLARRFPDDFFDTSKFSPIVLHAYNFAKQLPQEAYKLIKDYNGDVSNIECNGVVTFDVLLKTAQSVQSTSNSYRDISLLIPEDYTERANLTFHQKAAVQYMRRIEPIRSAQGFILEHASQPGEFIDAEGNLTIAFFEEAYRRVQLDNVGVLMEPSVLASAVMQEQRIFWDYYLQASPSLRITLMQNRNHVNRIIMQNTLTLEKIEPYIEVITLIAQSPSQEIQRLKEELIRQIIQTDNPVATYRQVEDVFVRNNLPTVGKIFRVFEILNSPSHIEQKLRASKLSPVLQQASQRRRYDIIYRDLLRVHVGSANHSLREFIVFLRDGEQIFDKVTDGAPITEIEERKARYALQKLETLRENSLFGRQRSDQMPSVTIQKKPLDLPVAIAQVRQSLHVAGGQTITDRIASMFVRPIGFTSIDEIIQAMDQARAATTQRSMRLYQRARSEGNDRYLMFAAGDLVKGVQERYIENILQNGVVAKEYLGASAGSDSTPFGTDATEVTLEDSQAGFNQALQASVAAGYGNLAFVLRNHGQFQATSTDTPSTYDQSKYEIYAPQITGPRHRDVRTGLPSSEIEFMVALDTLLQQPRELEKVFYAIAQQGMYIPVTDAIGKIIFTPEMYREYRRTFAGIERFDGEPIEVTRMEASDPLYQELQATVTQIRADEHSVRSISAKVRSMVEGVLGAQSITLQDEFDTSLLGAQLYDIGSSGRHTNVPGDYDFDLTLILDAKDMPKANAIKSALIVRLEPERDASHEETSGFVQVRAIGSSAILAGNPLDVDIGISPKSVVRPFATHDAIKVKLEWIRSNHGEDAYYEVLSNIVLAKRILKKGHAYKRVDDGGFGGVGTETWILANCGNFRKAAESFVRAAFDAQGQKRSLEEFRKHYKLFDAGMNLKSPYHDNFVYNLKENGYEAMVTTLQQFIRAA